MLDFHRCAQALSQLILQSLDIRIHDLFLPPRRIQQAAHQRLGVTHRHSLCHDFAGGCQLPYIIKGQQRSRVSHLQFARRHQIPDTRWQVEQP